MSYIPRAQWLRTIVASLRTTRRTVTIADMHNPLYDWNALHEVLLALTCPVPCVGVRRRGESVDWHAECVARADVAVEVIRSLGLPGSRVNTRGVMQAARALVRESNALPVVAGRVDVTHKHLRDLADALGALDDEAAFPTSGAQYLRP